MFYSSLLFSYMAYNSSLRVDTKSLVKEQTDKLIFQLTVTDTFIFNYYNYTLSRYYYLHVIKSIARLKKMFLTRTLQLSLELMEYKYPDLKSISFLL